MSLKNRTDTSKLSKNKANWFCQLKQMNKTIRVNRTLNTTDVVESAPARLSKTFQHLENVSTLSGQTSDSTIGVKAGNVPPQWINGAENNSQPPHEDSISKREGNQLLNIDFGNLVDGTSTVSDRESNNLDKSSLVTKFLLLIESQQRLGENCTAGTELRLRGVVDRYGQERFRQQAELTVKRANLLTWLWKFAAESQLSETLLQSLVVAMVKADTNIFAAGNCYDQSQYMHYHLFCPFAHRSVDHEPALVVKDLAREYHYLSNSSEWFFRAREKANSILNRQTQGYRVYTVLRDGDRAVSELRDILPVTYEDGYWSQPYFDCGGGNIWMMTYTVPFFGFRNNTYFFKGTSGIDIDLRRVDIDQCPQVRNSSEVNIFAGSDKCKTTTTRCVHVPGLGFRRGSYRCVCRDGYYFPGSTAAPYYNGSLIEDVYENKLRGLSDEYDLSGQFECVPCAEGCDTCEDSRPCQLRLNWLLRTSLLVISVGIICLLPFVVYFTVLYGKLKVVRAASPVLLRVITLGAFFIYTTTIVLYPQPTTFVCIARYWLREIGFSLSYGALMLKTWRISIIFRVKSARAVKITDTDLLRRLGCLVGSFSALLAARSALAPPPVMVEYSAGGLKAYLCHTDWWDHLFSSIELLFLVWGIRLCIVVRKAPSEFNESRFISLSIYNEFLLTFLLNISTLFLKSPANPDLLFIIFFLHNQLTMTVLLALIFGSKMYLVWKGHGRKDSYLNSSKNRGPSGASSGAAVGFSSGAKNQSLRPSQTDSRFRSGGASEPGAASHFAAKGSMEHLTAELEQLMEQYRARGDTPSANRVRAMLSAGRQQLTAVQLCRTVIHEDESPPPPPPAGTAGVSISSFSSQSQPPQLHTPRKLQGLLSSMTDQLVSVIVPDASLADSNTKCHARHLVPAAQTIAIGTPHLIVSDDSGANDDDCCQQMKISDTGVAGTVVAGATVPDATLADVILAGGGVADAEVADATVADVKMAGGGVADDEVADARVGAQCRTADIATENTRSQSIQTCSSRRRHAGIQTETVANSFSSSCCTLGSCSDSYSSCCCSDVSEEDATAANAVTVAAAAIATATADTVDVRCSCRCHCGQLPGQRRLRDDSNERGRHSPAQLVDHSELLLAKALAGLYQFTEEVAV